MPDRAIAARQQMTADRYSRPPSALDALDGFLSGLGDPGDHSDPSLLIATAESLNRAFMHPTDGMPRTLKARARKLLAIYAALGPLAAAAPRGAGGILLCSRDADLVPWTPAKPSSVAEIPVFALRNLAAWTIVSRLPDAPSRAAPQPRAAGSQPARTVPAPPQRQPPRPRPSGPDPRLRSDVQLGLAPAPVPPPAPKPVSITLIKTPGMTFVTELGRAQIYGAVLRILTRQALTDARATAIARSLGNLATAGQDRVDTFERLNVGAVFQMELHPPLFERLATVPELAAVNPATFKQVMGSKDADGISEMFPDFSVLERFALVALQLGATGGVVGSQFERGHVYFGGLIFVSWGKAFPTGDPDDNNPHHTTWYAPDGRILSFVYDEKLEAVIQGFKWGAGGITLAWATIAIGVLAFTLPAAAAFAAEAGAAELVSSLALRVWTSPITFGLGFRGLVLFEIGTSAVNLGQKIRDQGLMGFLHNMNPGAVGWPEAILNIISNLLDLLNPVTVEWQVRDLQRAAKPRSEPPPEEPPAPAKPALVEGDDDISRARRARASQRPQDEEEPRAGGAATDNRAVVDEHALQADADVFALEVVELEQLEAAAGAQDMRLAAGGGGGGRRASAVARGTAKSSRAVSPRGGTTSPKGTGKPPSGPVKLDDALCVKLKISGPEKAWYEKVTEIWQEVSLELAHVTPAWDRGVRAHIETQRRMRILFPESDVEEPMAVQASSRSKVTDASYRPATGGVAEFKPWAFIGRDRRLITSRIAAASGVATLQIQAYEILQRDIKRPVIVITESGKCYAPDPYRKRGWIQVGGPGW